MIAEMKEDSFNSLERLCFAKLWLMPGLHRLKDTPQGLKPISFLSLIGTTEVVP
jgi:hypothetical protein